MVRGFGAPFGASTDRGFRRGVDFAFALHPTALPPHESHRVVRRSRWRPHHQSIGSARAPSSRNRPRCDKRLSPSTPHSAIFARAAASFPAAVVAVAAGGDASRSMAMTAGASLASAAAPPRPRARALLRNGGEWAPPPPPRAPKPPTTPKPPTPPLAKEGPDPDADADARGPRWAFLVPPEAREYARADDEVVAARRTASDLRERTLWRGDGDGDGAAVAMGRRRRAAAAARENNAMALVIGSVVSLPPSPTFSSTESGDGGCAWHALCV